MTEDPARFESLALEDCMSAIIDYRGKTPRKTAVGIPLITAKVVKGGRIETPTEFIDPSEYDSWMRRGLPKVGDVLLTTEAPLGEVAQLTQNQIALAQRLILLRGKPDLLDNTYLKFLLMSEPLQSDLRGRASGTTVIGIKQSELRKVMLPLPSIDKQRAIAGVLGALDDKIEQNRRTAQALERLARAIFRAWFVEFAPVKAKAAGATAFPSMPQPVFDALPTRFIDSEIGLVPEGWVVKPLSSICELVSGGTPKRAEAAYWGGGIPWYSVRDAPSQGETWVVKTSEYVTEEGIANSAAKVLPKGCTIISARGTVGKLAMAGVPMAFNQSCYGLMPADGRSYCHLQLLMQTTVAMLQQRTHGSVFETITRATFDSLIVVQPPSEVLTRFESEVASLFDMQLAALQESAVLAEMRDYLLPKLLSGTVQVEVSDG
ncbi:MAG: restriction endonuclease subunit S [Wenzhouxiangella sp.]